jgi:4-hydroxybenzoate polyprenyltransferase
MEFTQQDIESVAKGRVSRAEGKSLNKIVWIMFVGIVAGLILAWQVNMWAGYVVIILAVLFFVWQNSKITKKQNNYKFKLVNEWLAEKKKEESDKKIVEGK